jgi:hypothetical protein
MVVFQVTTPCTLEMVTYVLKEYTGFIFRVTTFWRMILPLYAGYPEDGGTMFC